MKLFDRLMKYGLSIPDDLWTASGVDAIRGRVVPEIYKSTVVDVGDIANAYFNGDLWKITGPRLLTPPYPHMFVEATMPQSHPSCPGWQFASYTVTHDFHDSDNPTADVLRVLSEIRGKNIPSPGDVKVPLRWVVDEVIFFRYPGFERMSAMGPMYISRDTIDENGHQGRDTTGAPLSALFSECGDVSLAREMHQTMGIFFAHTRHLMNCKNIHVVDKPVSRQHVRERKRRGLPEVKFKTLAIGSGFGQSGTRPSHAAGDRALHLVRGHFATYTEDKPLFGKHTGTFWIPAHVRGTSEAGVVIKDYKVKAGGAA